MHALKVFRSPVWLLLHKLSSPHYGYIRKMRRGDRLPLTQKVFSDLQQIGIFLRVHRYNWNIVESGIKHHSTNY